MSEPAHVVHWVGTVVRVGAIVRQRCMWCGALIAEEDIDHVAWTGGGPHPFVDEEGTPKTQWEPGTLVAIAGDPDGGASVRWRVEPPDDKTPPDSCMAIDTAVTG